MHTQTTRRDLTKDMDANVVTTTSTVTVLIFFLFSAKQVRRAFMDEDFNWEKLRGAVGRRIEDGGAKLKANYLQRSMDSTGE